MKTKIKFDANLFEMTFTITCMIVVGVFGVLTKPQDLAISTISYFAMTSVVGFAIGFIISNFLVWLYKEIKKIFRYKSHI